MLMFTPGPVAPGHPTKRSRAEVAAMLEQPQEVQRTIRPPRRMPGRGTTCFSPARLFSLTHVTRDDIDVEDIDLWLTEEPLETVHKQGVMVGAEWFWAAELLLYTTGSRADGAARPQLVLRYDRSRLARGVLDEVRVLERSSTGYRLICVARPRDEAIARLDRDRFFAARDAHRDNLLARRTALEHEYVTLQAGPHGREELLQDIDARRAFREANPGRAQVARPIEGGPEPTEGEITSWGAALREPAGGKKKRRARAGAARELHAASGSGSAPRPPAKSLAAQLRDHPPAPYEPVRRPVPLGRVLREGSESSE